MLRYSVTHKHAVNHVAELQPTCIVQEQQLQHRHGGLAKYAKRKHSHMLLEPCEIGPATARELWVIRRMPTALPVLMLCVLDAAVQAHTPYLCQLLTGVEVDHLVAYRRHLANCNFAFPGVLCRGRTTSSRCGHVSSTCCCRYMLLQQYGGSLTMHPYDLRMTYACHFIQLHCSVPVQRRVVTQLHCHLSQYVYSVQGETQTLLHVTRTTTCCSFDT